MRLLGVAYVTHPLIQMGGSDNSDSKMAACFPWEKKSPNDLLIGLLANLPSGFHGWVWLETRRTLS